MNQPPLDPELEQQPEQISLSPVVRDDPKFASGKIAFFQYATVGVFVFLISGFWALQVRNPDIYSERATRNKIKSLPIPAPRGRILDRDGRVIVDNHASYSLIISRETLKPEHLRPIADGLNLDYDDLVLKLNRYKNGPKYLPVIVKEELTPSDLAFVESHRDSESFPEMELIPSQRRLYPQNGMAAHVIGYTGEISEAELDLPEFAKYDPGAIVGKFGIEKQYNDMLTGIDGQRQVEVDNRGRERRVLGIKEAVPGKDLQLTIDLDLQAVAELAMEGRDGAVVALDPRSGEVLAMVSRPSFDPNKFAVRIKAADWKEIVSNPDNPLLNRAIQAQLAPGSTFKPLMALAALDSGTVDENFSIGCSGGASFYGHYHRCWQKGGHGRVALHKGIQQSCDVYFYTVGNKMGIDTIAHYAEEAGLGQKTGIDLPQEKSGIVPSTKWKARVFRQKWYPGETISVSIGQGALTTTPLQLARYIGGLAMGGVWHHPHLVKDLTKTEKPHTLKLKPEAVKLTIDGMWGVVNEGGGTGGRSRLAGYDVCGKTGSAQVASNDFVKGKRAKDLKDNAWFVAFAPRDNPEIAVAVLWQHGEHGMLAAPIARDVLKAYFDKKVRIARDAGRPALPPAPRTIGFTPPPANEVEPTGEDTVERPTPVPEEPEKPKTPASPPPKTQ